MQIENVGPIHGYRGSQVAAETKPLIAGPITSTTIESEIVSSEAQQARQLMLPLLNHIGGQYSTAVSGCKRGNPKGMPRASDSGLGPTNTVD